MKKFILLFILGIIYPLNADAIIKVKQEITTEKATYSCHSTECERTKGEIEIGTKFQYTSITTSNSGNSVSKRDFSCETTQTGASCKPVY